jgi:hypothetical protein
VSIDCWDLNGAEGVGNHLPCCHIANASIGSQNDSVSEDWLDNFLNIGWRDKRATFDDRSRS